MMGNERYGLHFAQEANGLPYGMACSYVYTNIIN